MLPKKNRADKKDLENLFKIGRSVNSPGLTFKFLVLKKNLPAKISFIVPKKVASKAIIRNSLRRQGYRFVKNNITDFPTGLIGAFIFKSPINSYQKLSEEIGIILSKMNK